MPTVPRGSLARAWRLARLFGCMVVACPPAASRDDERRVDRRRGRACPARRGDRGRTGRGGARAPTATGARRSVFQRRARRRGTFGSRRPCDRRGPRGSAHRSRPAPRRSGGGGGAGIRQPAASVPRTFTRRSPLCWRRGPTATPRPDVGRGERVQVEFVSANPTGPLHVGNGWFASFGDAFARLLQRCGYVVEREYYLNDTGNQIRLLGESLLARRAGVGAARGGLPGRLPRRARGPIRRPRGRGRGGPLRLRRRRREHPLDPRRASESSTTSGTARPPSRRAARSRRRSPSCAPRASSTTKTGRPGSPRASTATTATVSLSPRPETGPTSPGTSPITGTSSSPGGSIA